MSDDLLRELMSSPLDDGPRRTRSGEPSIGGAGATGFSAAWFVTALLAGIAAVAIGWILGSDGATTPATTTSTTIATDPFDGSPQGLPESYTRVDDRLGIRAERILQRPDGTFITFSTVVQNTFDAEGTIGFQGGLWTLVLEDGTEIQSTTEGFDPLAQGAVSVWFPPAGYTIDEISAVRLSGTAQRLTNHLDTTGEGPTTVAVTAESGVDVALATPRFELDAGVTLEFDPASLRSDEAHLDWRLDGDTRANAFVSASLVVELPDGTERTLEPQTPTSAFSFFHPSVPAPPLTRTGRVPFDLDSLRSVDYPSGSRISVSISVVWATYAPSDVVIPLDGVATAIVR